MSLFICSCPLNHGIPSPDPAARGSKHAYYLSRNEKGGGRASRQLSKPKPPLPHPLQANQPQLTALTKSERAQKARST